MSGGSDALGGAAKGAGTGASIGAAAGPVGAAWGAAIGGVLGGVGGIMGGKRKKRAAAMKKKAMQEAMQNLKVDPEKERGQRQDDILGGQKFFNEKLAGSKEGKAAFAKMADDPQMQEILQRRRQQMEEGISSEERQAMRTNMSSQMAEAMGQQGLSLGSKMGARKGVGMAAVMATQQQKSLQAQAGIERDIFLEQQRAKREGLSNFESSYSAQKTFDIGQSAKKFGAGLAMGISDAQMGQATRNANQQMQAKMMLEQGLSEAEDEASGGFMGMF
jgi:hypothetical protein